MDNIEIDITQTTQDINVDVAETSQNISVEVSSTRGDAGYSAYQIAVMNGYVGTEEQWLASLQGTSGSGVPLGGEAGQLLRKKSNADFDTEWSTFEAGNHASLSNLDYASSGHTGFQPAGSYITTETDPVFVASEAHKFVSGDKSKLDGIETGADVNVNPDWNATSGYAQILNKPTIPTALSDLSEDSEHRVVTDGEKNTWNGKQNAIPEEIKRLKNTMSTGLYNGGLLTINTDPAKFNISAGFGVVVDNYTDPENPVLTTVTWGNMNALETPYLATHDTSYVYIDKNGAIGFHTDVPSNEDRRDYIELGWLDHTSRTEIGFAMVEPFYNSDIQAQFNDFIEAFGSFNIDGNVYGAYSGLTIQRTAGKTFDGNANYYVSKKDPHVVTTELEAPASITYYYRDGTLNGWVNDSASTIYVDPNYYDDNSGSLVSVPSGKWTIQPIAFYANMLANDIQYGQQVYDTVEEALSALETPVAMNPYNSYDTFRCWLVVKQGATDLTDSSQARFITAGKFGMFGGSTGTGGSGEINTASNVGTSGSGLYYQKSGVDLEFKNIDAGNNLISIADNSTNKALEISVNESLIQHQNIFGAGTNSHAQIDTAISNSASHISAASPHSGHVISNSPISSGSGTKVSFDSKGLITSASSATQDDILDGATYKRYSLTEKIKLEGIQSGAEVNVNADWNASSGDAQILNKPTIPDQLSDLSDDSTHRVVTDAEKSSWNSKLSSASNVGAVGYGLYQNTSASVLHFANISSGSNISMEYDNINKTIVVHNTATSGVDAGFVIAMAVAL